MPGKSSSRTLADYRAGYLTAHKEDMSERLLPLYKLMTVDDKYEKLRVDVDAATGHVTFKFWKNIDHVHTSREHMKGIITKNHIHPPVELEGHLWCKPCWEKFQIINLFRGSNDTVDYKDARSLLSTTINLGKRYGYCAHHCGLRDKQCDAQSEKNRIATKNAQQKKKEERLAAAAEAEPVQKFGPDMLAAINELIQYASAEIKKGTYSDEGVQEMAAEVYPKLQAAKSKKRTAAVLASYKKAESARETKKQKRASDASSGHDSGFVDDDDIMELGAESGGEEDDFDNFRGHEEDEMSE